MKARLYAGLCAAIAIASGCNSGTSSTSTTDGGAGTGGSAQGGSGGAGGSSTGKCKADSECRIAADCCGTCRTVLTTVAIDLCDAACALDACQATGVISAHCSDSACAPTYNCSDTYHDANCEPPPSCPAGELPVSARHYSAPPGEKCWTGACVPSSSCEHVEGCSACEAGAYCLEYVVVGGAAGGSGTTTFSCRKIPAACAGSVNCNCAGDCGTEGDCQDTTSGVRCTFYAP